MLLFSELRKIWGQRGFIIFFAVMLILNLCVSLYFSNKYSDNLPLDVVEDFYDWYEEDPTAFALAYDELIEEQEAMREAFKEQIKLGNYEYEETPLPNRYAPEGYTDLQLFNVVLDGVNYASSYRETVNIIIQKAEQRLLENQVNGIGDNSFSNRYQMKVIDCYNCALSNVDIDAHYAYGWEEYLSYCAVDLFVFAVISVLASIIYTQELQSGFASILRICKRGRGRTALSKMIAGVISVGMIVVVFTVSTLCVYSMRVGFSNPFNAVQILPSYITCPFVLSVGEVVLLSLGVKLLVFISAFLLLVRMSMWIRQYTGSFIAGVALLGINYALSQYSYINPNAYGRVLNIFSAISPSTLFSKYLGVNVFGFAVDSVFAVIGLYAVIFILAFIAVLLGGRERLSPLLIKIKVLPKLKKILRKNKNSNRIRVYNFSFTRWELFKTWNSLKIILIVLVLFAIKVGITYTSHSHDQSFGDYIYEEYMDILSGEINDDKRQYIKDEREKINNGKLQYQSAKELFLRDEMSYDEYRVYLLEYDYAYNHDPILTMIEEHLQYIDELTNNGKNAWFVYDTGWKAMFLQSFDWTAFAVTLIVFSGVFSREYTARSSSGGAHNIIRCTMNGRKKTFIGKYSSVLYSAILIFVFWSLLEISFIIANYELPLINAPICSIQALSDLNFDMNIGVYLVMYYITRLLAVMILSSIVCAFSAAAKSSLGCAVITVVLTVFPSILSSFGFNQLKYVDFVSFIKGTPILLHNSGGIIFMVCCLIISIMLSIYTAKKWSN